MINYEEYVSEQINKSIAYSEYVAEQINFSEYLSGIYDTKNFKRKIKIKNLFN